ncbi:MAG: Gfo/Idh/MocA family oxidoreductase [Lentisphaeraceae bacterium]|nr:Gfo/Idh/MocA family oxidoreductase [Lentisphaeraceae bacterium]
MSGKIFKFGVVGAGMISQFHAKAFEAMPNAELVAIFDRNGERAEAFAKENNCAAYADINEFVAHDMDFVTICTPSGAHMDPAIVAANAGKHVIVEKPLDVTTEKIDAMLEACAKNNVQLIGVLPRRFNESTKIFKKAIEDGRFGKIVLADAYVKWWRTQEYYDSGAWRGTWALDGGGALMNQSIHTIDLLIHLMGDVKSVCAFAGLEAHKDIEVEDVAVAIVEFQNGARGVIQGSTACWSKEGHPAQVQISGDAGSAFMVDDKFSVWEFKDEKPEDAQVLKQYGVGAEEGGAGAADPSAISFEWHQRNFEEAIQAVEEGRPSITGGVEGRRAVEVICAIYKSAKNGGEKVNL